MSHYICLANWRRVESYEDGITVVRWARGRGDGAPCLEFVVDRDGPVAASLEVDKDISIVELAGVLLMESRRHLPREALS